MVKIRMVNDYDMNDIPDHMREEFLVVVRSLGKAVIPVLNECHPNYALSALVHILAMYLHSSIVDEPEEISRATLVCAKNLIKNVEFYSKVDILMEGRNDP